MLHKMPVVIIPLMKFHTLKGFVVRAIAATALFGAFATGAQAATVMIFPEASCFNPADSSCIAIATNQGNDADVIPQLAGLNLLYEAESADTPSSTPQSESGTYRDYYSTEFLTTPGDNYTGANITHDVGDPSIDCGAGCYLVVKDGKHAPGRYLFDLADPRYSWDGLMTLALSGFWENGVQGSDGGGSISHVAIYGISPIPLPASVWLFGSALIGFIGYSRRRSIS